MTVVALLSFSVVAGMGRLVVLALGAAIVASRWVGWRYSTTREQHRMLLAVLGLPFVGLTLMIFSQNTGGTATATVNTAQRIAVVGCIYLIVAALLEVYRVQGQGRSGIYHMSMLMVMMVAGLNYRNVYYPEALALYGVAGVLLLRPARRDPWALLAYALALAFAHWFFNYIPELGVRFYRAAYLNLDALKPEAQVFTASSDMNTVRRASGSRALLARVLAPGGRLRGQIMVTYENNAWTAPQQRSLRQELRPVNGEFVIRDVPGQQWTIFPVKATVGILPVPPGACRLRGDMPFVDVDPWGGLYADTLQEYPVWTDGQLVGPTDGCLQVPDDLRQPLLERARQLSAGASSPLEVARALEAYLQEHGVYDGMAKRGRDQPPLLDFLDNGMRGYCEYFATSLALMLRVRGVPTRYVIGFNLRERNPLGGYWMVRDLDAHAWVEAWLDGQWQTFDPTPPAAVEPRAPDAVAAATDGFKLSLIRLWTWLQAVEWAKLAQATATGLALPLVGVMLWRRWRRWRQPAPTPLEVARARAERRWARLGLVRAEGETWWEFAARFPEGEGDYARRWVEAYCAARYGGAEFTEPAAPARGG